MEIKGTLKNLLPVIERGEFKSRKVWVTTEDNPQYPQTIELEVSGKSLDIFDGVSIGAPVICHCNLRGREWTDPQSVVKVFNTIQCWKVAADGVAPTKVATGTQQVVDHTPPEPLGDLPF